MGNLFSSNKVSDAGDKRWTFFQSKAKAAPKEKTPTEQLEAESQVDAKVDAPEATVPVSSEEKQESPVDEQQLEKKEEETGKTSGTIPEETVAEVQQEVAEEQKMEPTTGSSPKSIEFSISISATVSEAVDAEKKSSSEQDDASEDDDSPPETLPEVDI